MTELGEIKCVLCLFEGLKSQIRLDRLTILDGEIYLDEYWEENGKRHFHSRKVNYYKCSNGHRFFKGDYNECCEEWKKINEEHNKKLEGIVKSWA